MTGRVLVCYLGIAVSGGLVGATGEALRLPPSVTGVAVIAVALAGGLLFFTRKRETDAPPAKKLNVRTAGQS